MYIEPSNPIVHKKIQDFINGALPQSTHLLDVDNVRYMVSGNADDTEVTLSIDSSSCREHNAPFVDAMIEEKYAEFKGACEAEFSCTLHIDKTKLPSMKKVKRNMTEEEKEATKDENAGAKAEIADIAKGIASRVSCLKRDYMGAPILAAMNASLAGKDFSPLEIPYRALEKYYVFIPSAGSVQVIYGLNFPDKFERVLARTLCVQLKDCKGVQNPPLIAYHDKVEDRPKNLTAAFPASAKDEYSNGMISIGKYRYHFN